jgi:hypothetical protein
MVGYVKIVGCTTIMAQFCSTFGLQDSLTYMYYTSKCLYMNIPGNTAHGFFAFFWLTEGSRNKN